DGGPRGPHGDLDVVAAQPEEVQPGPADEVGEPEVVAARAEPLPEPVGGRHLERLAVAAQPVLDVGEREQGAGRRAADRAREVAVAASPVADRGASHPREPCDVARGHTRVTAHAVTLLALRNTDRFEG